MKAKHAKTYYSIARDDLVAEKLIFISLDLETGGPDCGITHNSAVASKHDRLVLIFSRMNARFIVAILHHVLPNGTIIFFPFGVVAGTSTLICIPPTTNSCRRSSMSVEPNLCSITLTWTSTHVRNSNCAITTDIQHVIIGTMP
mmetsp:Transcript_123836/g.346794  ORF Transcript_123836/g.346794 Transcript_123836/m.346794 type:complete len:144 (-) Transcript_123836:177-608(-)